MQPSQVVSNFERKVDTALSEYHELKIATFNKKREQPLKSRLAEQFARTISLDWENFINDVLLAHVWVDPIRCMEDLRGRLASSIKEKFGEEVVARIYFDHSKASDVSGVARLIDPKGFNLTFRKASDLSKKANDWLPASSAIKFSLARDKAELFDFFVALRNHLSHASASSLVELKSRKLVEPNNAALNIGTPFRISTYLKEVPIGQVGDRVEIMGQKMKLISASFS